MDKPTNWDLIVKVVGLIALVVSGAFTLYKFRDDRRVDLEHQHIADAKDDQARLQEFNKYIFERQADLYFESARTAAAIASSEDRDAVRKATDRFHDLYWGDLVVVEDRRVELAMIEFGACLDSGHNNCKRTVTTNQDGINIPVDTLSRLGSPSLKTFSLELAACVRSALAEDRGINFGKLTNPKTVCPYDAVKLPS